MLRAGWNGLCRVKSGLFWNPLVVRSYSSKPLNHTSGPTGTWEKIVYKGYNVDSFIPKDLPPKVDLSFAHPALGIPLRDTLKEADENLAELREKSQKLPISMQSIFLKKEAVGSCQIELNSRSLNDVMKEACGFMPPRTSSEKNEFDEVLQYIEALQLGLRLAEKEPLSVEMLETIHKALVVERPGQHYAAEVVPGKIRTSQIAVGCSAAPPFTSTFFPPPPKHVRRLLDNLMHFINEPSDMHPLLKMGISHVQFETIHPFTNGNGQLGRLLLMLKIMQSGLADGKLTLYPSYAFKVCRWLYFNSLQDTRNTGSWENWLQFFVGSVSHSARDAIELCEDLVALHTRHKNLIRGNNRRADIDDRKTDKLLDICYRMPYINKQAVAMFFGEDYSIAHELLDLFTRRGILEIARDDRNEVWYHNKAILDELNKERHVAHAVSLLGGWMKVPARIEVYEKVVTTTYATAFQDNFIPPEHRAI